MLWNGHKKDHQRQGHAKLQQPLMTEALWGRHTASCIGLHTVSLVHDRYLSEWMRPRATPI